MLDNRAKMTISQILDKAKWYEKLNIHMTIWGYTGIGKTAIIKEIAETCQRELRVFYPAAMEPTDLSGLPEFDKNTGLVEFWKTALLDFDPAKKYILFIDELNRAQLDVQQALLGLWNPDQYIGSHAILANVWVVTAMNDESKQEGVITQPTDDAQRTRSAQIELIPSLKLTTEYLKKIYGQNNLAVKYLQSPHAKACFNENFSMVYEDTDKFVIPTPRNLEMFAKAVAEMTTADAKANIDVIQSLVGTEVSGSVSALLEDMARIDPELLFVAKGTAEVLKPFLDKTMERSTEVLITAFNGAIEMISDKKVPAVDNFFSHLRRLHGKHNELIASFVAQLQKVDSDVVIEVMTGEKYHDFIIKYFLSEGESTDV